MTSENSIFSKITYFLLRIVSIVILFILVMTAMVFIDSDNFKPEKAVEETPKDSLPKQDSIVPVEVPEIDKDTIVDVPAMQLPKRLKDHTKSVTSSEQFQDSIQQQVFPVIGVEFAYKSEEIREEAIALIDDFISAYNKLEVETSLLIQGFTCSIGSEKYNKKLSEKRSLKIKSVLIDKGIDASKITIESLGKEHYIDTGDTKKDLNLNRRNNITIITNN